MKGREGESKFKMFSAQKIVSCSLLFTEYTAGISFVSRLLLQRKVNNSVLMSPLMKRLFPNLSDYFSSFCFYK